MALGSPAGDVDDGFALAALFAGAAGGAIELLGVSTVSGNTTAAQSEDSARRLSEIAGHRVSVVRGAEGPGLSSAAAARLAELPEETELLCLGPLTNVAAAARLDASLPGRCALHAVGGNLSSRGFLPPLWPFEYNLSRDREAARRVLAMGWRGLRLYPLDVVRRMRADRARLERLSRLGPLGAALDRGSGRWLRRARWRYLSRSFPVYDLPAALELVGLIRLECADRPPGPGFSRYFGNSDPRSFVLDLDPAEAWAAFETVLVTHPDSASAGA